MGDATPSKPPESIRNSMTDRSLINETFEKFGINSFLEKKGGDSDEVKPEETPEKRQAAEALDRIPDYSFLSPHTLALPTDFFR